MTRFSPFEALIPEAFVVLGVRLQPFTLGHAALLMRLGGECWVDGGPCGSEELMLGIAVCSRQFLETHTAIYSGKIQELIDAVCSTIKPGDLEKERAIFERYITEGTRGPSVRFEHSDSAPMRSHVIQSLRVQMMKFLRVPFRDVVDIPISAALWDMATLSEMNGVAKIWGEEDDDAQKAADEFDEKYRASLTTTEVTTEVLHG